MKETTVQIEGAIWRIVPCKRCEMQSPDNDGECDFDSLTIRIYNRLSFSNAVDTLLHEIEHAQQPDIRESYVRRRANEKTRALFKTGLLKQEAKKVKRNATC